MTTPDAAPAGFVPKFPEPAPAVPQAVVSVPPPAPEPFDPGMLVLPGLIVGSGLIIGVIAWILWRRSQRIDPAALFRVLDSQPDTAGTAHVEFPPVDLHRPIAGEAAWRAIRIHATDAAYLAAVETVRRRFENQDRPMALANLLRDTMAGGRVGFREAVLRLAVQGGAPPPPALVLEDDRRADDRFPPT